MSTAAPLSAAPALPPHVLGYRALKLWQRALDLAADAHRLAHGFAESDQLALAADLRRAAAGVPAAVAASAMALDRVDQQRALQGATAALARLETLAALAERLEVLSAPEATALLFTSGDVTRLLRGLTRSVAARGAGAVSARAAVAEAAPAPAPVQRVAESNPEVRAPVEAAPIEALEPVESTARPAPAATPPSMRGPGRRRGGGRSGPVAAP